MQPIGNRLVPSMLSAGANTEIAFVKFFCDNELCNSSGLFILSAFLFFLSTLDIPSQEVSFN